ARGRRVPVRHCGSPQRGGGSEAEHDRRQHRRDRAPGAGHDAGGSAMSDRALELFEQYLEQRASGQQPDAAALVHEAGDQADVLAGMIAAYAATHPADVTEGQLEQMVVRPELEPPRPWPELLPALRERTHTTRATLVSRLCEALGVPGSQRQGGDYAAEIEDSAQ